MGENTYLNTYLKHMSVRKMEEKNIRKITRVGKTSLAVTLPIEIACPVVCYALLLGCASSNGKKGRK